MSLEIKATGSQVVVSSAQLCQSTGEFLRCRDRQLNTQQQTLEIAEPLEHPRPFTEIGVETDLVEPEYSASCLAANQHAQIELTIAPDSTWLSAVYDVRVA